MITINLLHHLTRLPVRERAVQLIFTDTAFGWMRLNHTDDQGMTTADTYPGPARIYVDGEFYKECWLEGKMEFFLSNDDAVEQETVVDLTAEPLPETAEHIEEPLQKTVEQTKEPAGQLIAVPYDGANPHDFLIA